MESDCNGVETKEKAVKSDPGGRTKRFWREATPYGVGIRLNGSALRLPHLAVSELWGKEIPLVKRAKKDPAGAGFNLSQGGE
jgi:hypothetical protein